MRLLYVYHFAFEGFGMLDCFKMKQLIFIFMFDTGFFCNIPFILAAQLLFLKNRSLKITVLNKKNLCFIHFM